MRDGASAGLLGGSNATLAAAGAAGGVYDRKFLEALGKAIGARARLLRRAAPPTAAGARRCRCSRPFLQPARCQRAAWRALQLAKPRSPQQPPRCADNPAAARTPTLPPRAALSQRALLFDLNSQTRRRYVRERDRRQDLLHRRAARDAPRAVRGCQLSSMQQPSLLQGHPPFASPDPAANECAPSLPQRATSQCAYALYLPTPTASSHSWGPSQRCRR